MRICKKNSSLLLNLNKKKLLLLLLLLFIYFSIFSITLLLVLMSLYSANKSKSTLPPSGLKPILLDSGWFRSFFYALHNFKCFKLEPNGNDMNLWYIMSVFIWLYIFCRWILLLWELTNVAIIIVLTYVNESLYRPYA